MSALTLCVVRRTPDLLLACPESASADRLVLWPGEPPARVPDHASVAPIVLEGWLNGEVAYAEQLPPGVPAARGRLPTDLSAYVVARVLDALRFLHDLGESHGEVGPDRIALGLDGEVVLFGRGRHSGLPRVDRVACLSLLHGEREHTLVNLDLDGLLAEVSAAAPEDGAQRLAAWVRAQQRDPGPGPERVTFHLEAGDAVDEIVPDLGPDRGEGGLLERWAVTTSPGRTPPDITEEVSSTAPVMGITLWNRLSSPLPDAPPDRFAAVSGTPSRALRDLLAEDPPDPLPGPLVGPLPAFVLEGSQFDDQPTIVGAPRVTESAPPLRPRAAPEPGVPLWLQWVLAMTLGGLLMWGVMVLWGP